MIEPIRSASVSPITWPDSQPTSFSQQKKKAEKAAENYNAWYTQSSLQSLNPTPSSSQNSISAVSEKKVGLFGKIRDWFRGLFKKTSKETPQEDPVPVNAIPPISSANAQPTSETSDASERKLAQAVADIHGYLVKRIKDITEFEEEMRTSSTKSLDYLIFRHLVATSLDQRRIKQDESLQGHEDVLEKHKRNKDLKDKHFSILKEIDARKKTNSILHTVNIVHTAGLMGILALGFATGGTSIVLGGAVSLMSISKGGLTLTEGILKYKNDKKTGELSGIRHESKTNSTRIDDRLETVRFTDEEIASLIKAVRNYLDQYSEIVQAMHR